MNSHQRRVRGRKGLSGWLKNAPPGEVYAFRSEGVLAAFRAHEVAKQQVLEQSYTATRQQVVDFLLRHQARPAGDFTDANGSGLPSPEWRTLPRDK